MENLVGAMGGGGVLPLNFREWHHANERVACAASLAANAALAALLLSESHAELRAYTKVLLQNCVVDSLFTVVTLVTELQMEFVEGRMVFIVNGLLSQLPIGFVYPQAFFYVFFQFLAIFVLPIVFYFRYALIVRGDLLETRKLARLLGAAAACAAHQAVASLCTIMRNAQFSPLYTKDCAEILVQPLWTQGGGGSRDYACMATNPLCPVLIYYLFTSIVVTATVFCLMGYYTLAVAHFLTHQGHTLTVKTMRLQRQMTTVLVIQMVLPLWAGIVPVCAMAVWTLLRLNAGGLGLVATMALAWLPLVNPLSTLLLVSLFRRRLVSLTATVCSLARVRKSLSVTRRRSSTVFSLKSSSNNFFHFKSQF